MKIHRDYMCHAKILVLFKIHEFNLLILPKKILEKGVSKHAELLILTVLGVSTLDKCLVQTSRKSWDLRQTNSHLSQPLKVWKFLSFSLHLLVRDKGKNKTEH